MSGYNDKRVGGNQGNDQNIPARMERAGEGDETRDHAPYVAAHGAVNTVQPKKSESKGGSIKTQKAAIGRFGEGDASII